MEDDVEGSIKRPLAVVKGILVGTLALNARFASPEVLAGISSLAYPLLLTSLWKRWKAQAEMEAVWGWRVRRPG